MLSWEAPRSLFRPLRPGNWPKGLGIWWDRDRSLQEGWVGSGQSAGQLLVSPALSGTGQLPTPQAMERPGLESFPPAVFNRSVRASLGCKEKPETHPSPAGLSGKATRFSR